MSKKKKGGGGIGWSYLNYCGLLEALKCLFHVPSAEEEKMVRFFSNSIVCARVSPLYILILLNMY